MSAMASQITSLTIVYSTVYSGVDQRKHQSPASLAFVRGIHWWPVNSPHKGPVTRKILPFDDVIKPQLYTTISQTLGCTAVFYLSLYSIEKAAGQQQNNPCQRWMICYVILLSTCENLAMSERTNLDQYIEVIMGAIASQITIYVCMCMCACVCACMCIYICVIFYILRHFSMIYVFYRYL